MDGGFPAGFTGRIEEQVVVAVFQAVD